MLRQVVTKLQQAGAVCHFTAEQVLPQRYTLFDLANDLPKCQSLPPQHVTAGLSLCLTQADSIERVSNDDEAVTRITSHVAEFLGCTPGDIPLPDSSPNHIALVEGILGVLRILALDFSAVIDDATLLSAIAYTDSGAIWSTENVAFIAKELLDNALISDRKYDFIKSVLLEDFIRPIFSQFSSDRLTSSGRKSHYGGKSDHDHGSQHVSIGSVEMTPWKNTQLHAVTVFAWAVEQSYELLIEKCWPLYTPVLLALLDETDTTCKARGLNILQDFLARCPVNILRETGLGEIFEQSVFPSLLSLPTLTAEDEAVQLLDPAYNALIRLANAQFPEAGARPQRNRLLIKILREGLLTGYWHASEYVRIVELLARQVASVVQHLGAFTVPHLRELLTMSTNILTDPFFVSCPSCIQTTSHTLSVIMLNCWPRVMQPTHSGELLRAISICWLNLRDEESRAPDRKEIQEALAAISSLVPILSSIFDSANLSLQQQFSRLSAAEPKLVDLFGCSKI
ncbi:poly polymerase protein [Colletotrichum truncatum]|uniref:Poly polymerase protein n=1 Tax=Colletotrichum truncatum TaxID=5467 RepID=A0ACC3YMS9_COLTU